MHQIPTLDTERLSLCGFTENDLTAVYKIFSDETVNRFLPWFPLRSSDEADAFYRERLANDGRSGAYRYAVCLKSDPSPIGYISVSVDDSHDLGYGLLPAYWHRGFVTEAAGAVIRQLRRDGIPYITATHDIHNPRSGAVMRRLGMRYQYTYEEQWMPKNFPVTFRMYQLNFQEGDKGVYKKYWNDSAIRFVESDPLLS